MYVCTQTHWYAPLRVSKCITKSQFSSPTYNTGSLYINVLQHMVNTFLTATYTQAIRCLCFISYEMPRGIKLSKSVSVGNGRNMKLQEIAVRKSNEIMCEGTMKEASQGVISVTTCTGWTLCSLCSSNQRIHN